MSDMENECSLVGCMREVPDPRAPYNQKHKFQGSGLYPAGKREPGDPSGRYFLVF